MNHIEFTHPKGFPWSQKTLQFMQESYRSLMQAMVAHYGCTENKIYLLQGIEQQGELLTDGWCVIKNEVLPFEGGKGSSIAREQTAESVTYQDGNDRQAYFTSKAIISDTGTPISQCVRIPTDRQLENLINRNETPKGLIAMWSGSIGDVPTGWRLCNGEQGTPDLQDKFIVGAGQAYLVGNTGGKEKVSLSENEMPSHNHSGNTNSAGNHRHTGFTESDGSHDHSYRDGYFIEAFKSPQDQISSYGSEYVGTGFGGSKSTDADNRYIWFKDRTTDWGGSHSHTLDINNAGSHNHSFTTDNKGGGQAHENRPPYYALAYIMYIGF